MSGSRRTGFSLVEVNLAVLLVGVGLFALFALFPRGLRESEMAIEDTQEAQFGDSVLSAIEGNAADVTDWSDWTNTNAFQQAIMQGMVMSAINLRRVGSVLMANDDDLEFPAGSGRCLTYELQLTMRGTKNERRVWDVELQVASGRNRDLDFVGRDYFTGLMYMGE